MKKQFRFLDNFLIREKLLTIIGSFFLANLALAVTAIETGNNLSLVDPSVIPIITDTRDIQVRTQEGTKNHINYFRLILETPPTVDATVEYKTRDGSAIAGQDYVKTSGTATIKAGKTETLIGVEIIADTEIEGDETFDLVISNPQNGKFSGSALEIIKTHTIAGVDDSIPTDGTEITDKFISSENSIPDQYIVVLKDNFTEITRSPNKLNATAATVTTSTETSDTPVNNIAQLIVTKYGATLGDIYEDSIQGFSINVDEQKAKQIANEAVVAYVMEDAEIKLDDVIQTNNISESVTIDANTALAKTSSSVRLSRVYPNVSWNLDRIDQCDLPLNNTYTTDSDTGGEGVHAYVIDTGISQSHPDFTTTFGNGFNVIFDNNGTNDCHGHGTHVAGIIGSQTSGVAKNAILHPIRVLDCQGRGTISGVVRGINWVARNYTPPAVANISFTASRAIPVIDDAVRAAIRNGVTFVLAAGNSNSTACNASPARTREAITVGATDRNDNRSPFSNTGNCIDIFAPGSDIASTWTGGLNNTISSTGMSAAHVSGIVALYLEKNTTATPAMAISAVMSQSIVDVINNVGTDSPNLLAHSLSTERKPFFRYYNSNNGAHLYTTDWNELNAAGINSWKYESTEGYLADYIAGVTTPLYRYYNEDNNFKDYFYTIDWFALGYGKAGWFYEGIAGYIPIQADSDTTDFYRYVNAGHHFYTTDFNELGNGQNGWIREPYTRKVYGKRVCKTITTGCNSLSIDTNNEDIQINGGGYTNSITYLDDGGWLVSWSGATGNYIQRYNICGVKVGNEISTDGVFKLFTLTNGNYVTISRLAHNSNFLINNYAVNSSSTPLLTSSPLLTLSGLNNFASSFAAFKHSNDFITVRSDQYNNGTQHRAVMQRYNAQGQTIGGEVFNGSAGGNKISIATLDDGSWILVWSQNENQSNGITGGVFMHRYNNLGAIVGGVIQINSQTSPTGTWYKPEVMGLDDGGWLVILNPHDGAGTQEVRLQRYDAGGNMIKEQIIAENHNLGPGGIVDLFSIIELANHDWVIAWSSHGTAPGYISGAYMQRFDGTTGTPMGNEIRANKFLTNHDFPVSMTPLLDGGWIALWNAFDLGNTRYNLFMKRYDSVGNVIH